MSKEMCSNGCNKVARAHGLCHNCEMKLWRRSKLSEEELAARIDKEKENEERKKQRALTPRKEPKLKKVKELRVKKVKEIKVKEVVFCKNGCGRPKITHNGLCKDCFQKTLDEKSRIEKEREERENVKNREKQVKNREKQAKIERKLFKFKEAEAVELDDDTIQITIDIRRLIFDARLFSTRVPKNDMSLSIFPYLDTLKENGLIKEWQLCDKILTVTVDKFVELQYG